MPTHTCHHAYCEQLSTQISFLDAAALESKLISLLPASRALIVGTKNINEATVVSAYVLDKVGLLLLLLL